MENDSTNTGSTTKTNKSILSRTSQFLHKHDNLISKFRKTLNLAIIMAILYYVKTNNISMDNIPTVVTGVKGVLNDVHKLHNMTTGGG